MKIFSSVLIIFIFLSFSFVHAATSTVPDVITTNKTIWDLLNKAFAWFFYFIIIVAVIMIVYVGFMYITSGGDKTKLTTALRTLMYIAIGLVILIFAQATVNVIRNFAFENTSSSNNPNNANINQGIINNTPDELSNISLDELIQEAWHNYLDTSCVPTPQMDCCKCCIQGKQSDECSHGSYYMI